MPLTYHMNPLRHYSLSTPNERLSRKSPASGAAISAETLGVAAVQAVRRSLGTYSSSSCRGNMPPLAHSRGGKPPPWCCQSPSTSSFSESQLSSELTLPDLRARTATVNTLSKWVTVDEMESGQDRYQEYLHCWMHYEAIASLSVSKD